MASSSRYGLSATPIPRQKLGLEGALAASGTDGAGAEQVLADIRSRFSTAFGASFSFDAARHALSAVLESSENAFDIAVALQEAAWPLRLRFALVSAPPGGAAGQNDAIRDKCLRKLSKANKKEVFTFDLSGKSEAEVGLASALARLHSTLTDEWTPSRAVAVRTYRKYGKQAEVATALKVSQQAVSQMLLGARFRELIAAEKAMASWLSGPKRTTLWPLRNIGTAPAVL